MKVYATIERLCTTPLRHRYEVARDAEPGTYPARANGDSEARARYWEWKRAEGGGRIMPAGDFPYGYGVFPSFNSVTAVKSHWPPNVVQPAPTLTGWRCPGCSRCFAPSVSHCGFCGPESRATPQDITPVYPGLTVGVGVAPLTVGEQEYRGDGWPLCPRCGGDELVSEAMLDWNSIRTGPTLAQCHERGFICYECDWAGKVEPRAESAPTTPYDFAADGSEDTVFP